MTYARSLSAMKNAPSAARIHAVASLRVLATAASCSRPLSLTTFASASNSSRDSISPRKYARRALGLSVRRCVLNSVAVSVSSTDGGGISVTADGGSPARSGMDATPPAPRQRDAINARYGFACKAKDSSFPRVNHSNRPGGFPPAYAVAPSCGGADLPRVRDGAPIHHSRKAGLARPLCCTNPEAVRQSAKLSRGYVGLSHSLALKPHRSGLIFYACDLRPVAKLNENHGSHRSVSKCAPLSGASPQ